MRKITFVIMIALLSYCSVIAKNPSVSARNYWPGMYNDNNSWGNYKLGYWHKEAFHVSWGVAYKDPAVGYPYRSGNTDGVNDTVKVMVYFDNRTDDDYPIASATPQDWFYPVLYDPYVDVFDTPMLADTSTFEYRFENWITMSKGVITTKPDTIFSSPNRGYHLTYGLIYSMWGLTPGTLRVILKPTATKPSDVKLVVDVSQNLFTISTSQDILDTLNSYCTISINALSRKEFTLMSTIYPR